MRRKLHEGPSAQGRLVGIGGRWEPTGGEYSRDELAAALVHGCVAGLVTSHDRRNVRWKLHLLVEGDPLSQFGIAGLSGGPPDGPSLEQVLALMADAAGFDPDPAIHDGPTPIDPDRVLAACEAAAPLLADTATNGGSVLLATGHPGGLLLLYQALAGLLERGGAKILEPLDGFEWEHRGHRREMRYFGGVAAYTSRADMLHTHASEPMELLLAECEPDLVIADHGFAGAAIQAGIETISIVDVNDPAPVVARSQGRTTHVICMDDNVRPEAYWPCFQAMARLF